MNSYIKNSTSRLEHYLKKVDLCLKDNKFTICLIVLTHTNKENLQSPIIKQMSWSLKQQVTKSIISLNSGCCFFCPPYTTILGCGSNTLYF